MELLLWSDGQLGMFGGLWRGAHRTRWGGSGRGVCGDWEVVKGGSKKSEKSPCNPDRSWKKRLENGGVY